MPDISRSHTALLILIGLSGAGKSAVAMFAEGTGLAGRVRRFTTRQRRLDDDPKLVVVTNVIEASKGDLVIPGWGADIYCIRDEDVSAVRRAGLIPVVELGAYEDAAALRVLQQPAVIALVERPMDEGSARAILTEKGLSHDALEERLKSIAEDQEAIRQHRCDINCVIRNSGTLDDLQRQVVALVERLKTSESSADDFH